LERDTSDTSNGDNLFLYALWRDVDWNFSARGAVLLMLTCFYTPCGVTLIGTIYFSLDDMVPERFYTPCGVTLIGTSIRSAHGQHVREALVSIRLVA
jgi:hypothetical protein